MEGCWDDPMQKVKLLCKVFGLIKVDFSGNIKENYKTMGNSKAYGQVEQI